MAGKRSVEDKYHMLVVQSRDLIDRLEEAKEINKRLEKDKEHLDQLIKSFCEMILLNNSEKKTKGEEESWDSLSIEKLIAESTKSFRSYQQNNFQKFSKLMDLIETRTAEIEELEKIIKEQTNRQIAEQARNQGITDPEEIKRLQEECEKYQQEKKKKEEEERQNKILQEKRENEMATLGEKMKEQLRRAPGNVIFDTSDDDIFIEDEGEDIPKEEIQLREHAKNVSNISVKKPIKNRSKCIVAKNSDKQNSETNDEHASIFNVEDLRETMKQIDEYGWCILELIGSKGFSRYKEIEKEVMKIKNCAANKPRTSCKYLYSANVLTQNKVDTPKGRHNIYILTKKGRTIYEEYFQKKPVLSEAEKLKKEHTSYEHGYGIYFISQVFDENVNIKSVELINRKNPIKINSKMSYIPDIILTDKHERKMYIEYELNTHTQTDFNSKCRKMYALNKVMNFVIPSKKEQDSFLKKIEKWIRGSKDTIPGAIIRVVTYKGIDVSLDYWKNDSWAVIYDVDKYGDSPIMQN